MNAEESPRTERNWQAWFDLPAAERADLHLHLVGIAGSGLSAIANLLLDMGFHVSGSDQSANEATADLARRGAVIYEGHEARQVAGADLVLVSSAVPADNPELLAARAAGVPVVKRAQFLGELMARRHGVAVAGTHGKTTATAMLALILWRTGRDPSFIVGGRLPEFGGASAARAGEGPFVLEADEYDRTFLGLRARSAIVTNVEWDHVDCYETPAAYADAFREFAGQLPARGNLLLCADDPGAVALAQSAGPGVQVETYGLGTEPRPDWQALDLRNGPAGGLMAEVIHRGEPVAQIALAVPGRHNVANALAAVAAAAWFDVAPAESAEILRGFRGAGRRFEVIGEAAGVTVVDDYGHHPTEVAATLAAARQRFGQRRVWAVFQPHTFTRFQTLLEEFGHCFADADRVLVLDIYAARERDDHGVHSRQLLERLTDHPDARYAGDIQAAGDHLLAHVLPGDVVITLSAGSGNRVGQLLLQELKKRALPAVQNTPAEQAAQIAALVAAANGMGFRVTLEESLARHTTFRIGGPAEALTAADSPEHLLELASLAVAHRLPVTVLGGGSNVLIADAGIRGLVIINQARNIRIQTEGEVSYVVADSGAPLAGLARWTIRAGWTGLEWAVSVPGTVGGAVVGNAGAHGDQIAASLAWVEVGWPGRPKIRLTARELRLSYRSSLLKQALAEKQPVPLILSAGFELKHGEPADLAEQADSYLAHRRATQPVEPSAGSTFRNPPGDYAGRLIEAAGMKGMQIGGAQVSPRHANFIVNTGGARAADVVDLMQLAQERVYQQFGIDLVPEILLLGDWPAGAAGPSTRYRQQP